MALRQQVLAGLVAIPAAALLAAVPALGATALTVSGTRTTHDPPFPEQLLPTYFAGDTIDRIDYPAALLDMDSSIAIAAAGIVAGIADTVGPMIVAGYSQGAVAVAKVKQELMALPPDERPSPDLLSFLTIGDPTGPGGIMNTLLGRVPVLELTPITAPDTPYRSTIVNGEYDGWADFPDRQWNLLSVVNALLGTLYVHGGYETIPGGLDLSGVPAANIITTINGLGGSTTLYLLPTGKLPLVQPLRDIGVPEPIVAAIEKPLKALVDAGYVRNDAVAPGAATAATESPGSATVGTESPGSTTVETESPDAATVETAQRELPDVVRGSKPVRARSAAAAPDTDTDAAATPDTGRAADESPRHDRPGKRVASAR